MISETKQVIKLLSPLLNTGFKHLIYRKKKLWDLEKKKKILLDAAKNSQSNLINKRNNSTTVTSERHDVSRSLINAVIRRVQGWTSFFSFLFFIFGRILSWLQYENYSFQAEQIIIIKIKKTLGLEKRMKSHCSFRLSNVSGNPIENRCFYQGPNLMVLW